MIRKHIKVEPSRWFYHCDQIGMMVWQDMPSFAGNNLNKWGIHNYGEGTDFPATPMAKANYYKEWGEIIAQGQEVPLRGDVGSVQRGLGAVRHQGRR